VWAYVIVVSLIVLVEDVAKLALVLGVERFVLIDFLIVKIIGKLVLICRCALHQPSHQAENSTTTTTTKTTTTCCYTKNTIIITTMMMLPWD
jgi:hypothetical protein